VAACPSCGHDNDDDAKFCSECGARLEAPEPARQTRKTVTVVFCDVAGSTALGERLDPETVRIVMTRYFARMRQALEAHGGTVEKFIGDAVMAVFGVPVVNEDDALRAVRAADEMRRSLAALNEELERERGASIATRIGVNTGPVVAGDPSGGQNVVTGDTVNTAARLEQAAAAGEILIGEATFELVRDAVEVEPVDPLALKGKADDVPAYRLVSVHALAAGHQRRLDSPMVGRDRPLRMLVDAFGATSEDGASHLFTVFGPAGIGKSRLVREFVASASGSARVMSGRCLSYGDAVTYWPIAEMVIAAANIAEDDPPERAREAIASLLSSTPDGAVVAQHVAALLGLGAEGPVEPRWAIRRLFEAFAADGPLVVVIDDIHWADDALLDVIEHVVDRARDVPILLLCMARPELLDHRPTWAGGVRNATSVHLEPLSEREADALIENLLGMPALTAEIRERIRASAQGNPLFVEEMLAMLLDDGTLIQKDGEWVATVDLSTVAVPPAISALLAARLDRLGAAERAVLDAASIVGEVFERASIAAIAHRELDDLETDLASLLRKDLIRPSPSDVGAADDGYRFRHILLRDATYEQIPKDDRAAMHVAFANHLTQSVGDRVAEFDEFLGFHLASAAELWRELGISDARTDEARSRAFEHLAAAGHRAYGRADLVAAATLLSRAEALLAADDPRRRSLTFELGESLIETAAFESAEDVMRAIAAQASAAGDRDVERYAAMLATAASFFRGGATVAAFDEEAGHVIRHFEAKDDARGAAAGWMYRSRARWVLDDLSGAAEAAERSLEYAKRAGDGYITSDMRTQALASGGIGLVPVDDVLAAQREALADAQRTGDRRLEASALRIGGAMRSLRDDLAGALHDVRAARALVLDLGYDVVYFGSSQLEARILSFAGDLEGAARCLREGCEGLQALGETAYLSTTAAQLAEVEADRGDVAAADRWIEVASAAAAPDDHSTRYTLSSARGHLAAARGDGEESERSLREAIEIASEGTAFYERVEARLALADLIAHERPDEARALATEVLALAAQKQSDLFEREARRIIDGLPT
jgi:class 3 adenylate cyclase